MKLYQQDMFGQEWDVKERRRRNRHEATAYMPDQERWNARRRDLWYCLECGVSMPSAKRDDHLERVHKGVMEYGRDGKPRLIPRGRRGK